MQKDYVFAELPSQAVHRLREWESVLKNELGEEITLIAYEKETPGGESTACRADVEGN